MLHPNIDPLVAKKIHKTASCWLWLGSTNTNGYGHFVRRRNGRQVKQYVHRHVYEQTKGPIPKDHELHHVCTNRVCCNPDHLEPMSHQANLRMKGVGPR